MAKKLSPLVTTALREAGAILVRESNHYIYRLPNGRNLVVPKTASDHRTDLNTLSDLRRMQRQ